MSFVQSRRSRPALRGFDARVVPHVAPDFAQWARLALVLAAAGCGATAAQGQTFLPQGPAPSTGTLLEVQSGDVGGANGTVAGAVQAVVAAPNDANTLYISGVNGGVWKTTNGGASWTPLTDKAASLSIASLALDPLDTSNRTLIAGEGITSNGAVSFNNGYANRGGARNGLLYSSDGGASWSTLGASSLSGLSVLGVAARGKTLLAATYDPYDVASAAPGYGLYRSTDGGASFQQLGAGAGLSAGPTTSLAGDPGNAARLFVATTSSAANSSAIYASSDTGGSWTKVFDRTTVVNGDPAGNVINTLNGQTVIKLTAGPNGALAAGVIDVSTGKLAGLYLSLNAGQSWTALTVPTVDGGIHPGGQGLTNFAIAIDPTNPNIVYVAGDRQNGTGPTGTTFPNTIGAKTYTASVWAAQRNADNSTTLRAMTDNFAANGSTIHADSRNFAFDAAGRLILVGDGGVYVRTQPQSASGGWSGLNTGTLQLREIYGIGYDSVTNRLVVASQDTGAGIQKTPGKPEYFAVQGGDGVIGTVNDRSVPGQGIFYTSSQGLAGLSRTALDKTGAVLGTTSLSLNGVIPTDYVNGELPFSSKFVLNAFDPSKIAVGTNYVYLTQDTPGVISATGATLNLTSIGPTVGGVPGRIGPVTALAYGVGDDHDAVLAGSDGGLYLKQASDAELKVLSAYAGLAPSSVAFDRRTVQRFYAADTANLYGTADKGASFTALTASLPAGFSRPTALDFISTNGVNALVVGGLGAAANVSSTIAVADSSATGTLSNWRLFGSGLPNAQVSLLAYNPLADALAVGTFGRGAFLLYDVTSNFAQASALQFGLANNDSTPDASILTNGTSASRPLIKYGTGTLTIAGSATYTGGTTINDGALQLGNGGTGGSILGNVAFCASATDPKCNATTDKGLVFNRSDVASFAGVISGPGQVMQNGSGTTILTASSSYSGTTTVNGGTLQVDGAIASPALVNGGGRLAGRGSLGDITVAAGGALAPGDVANGPAVGTLRSTGNLTLQAGSAVQFEVASLADRLDVAGAAALGGTAALLVQPGALLRRYTLLTAGAGATGTFNAVATNLPSFFTAQLLYSPKAVDLALASSIGAVPNLNPTQQRIAAGLDASFNSGGGTLFGLSGVSTGQIGAALTALSGETATGAQQTGVQAMNQFVSLLLDPFVDGRGAAGGAPSAFAPEGEASAYASARRPATDAFASLARPSAQAALFDPRWSVWGSAFGGAQRTNGNDAAGSNTSTTNAFGFAAGADYHVNRDLFAGFALAGGGSGFSVAGGGSGRADFFQAGGFVRQKIGAAYIAGALAYGVQNVTTDRTLTIAGVDKLQANFATNALSGRIEAGTRFAVPFAGGFGLTPYAAGQFTTLWLPAYAEQAVLGTGNFALAYGAKTITDPRSELGLRADKSFALSDAVLTLRGRAAWAHDFATERSVAAIFQALPSVGFVVSGAAQGRDSALLTTAAELAFLNGWSVSASFDGEFSRVARAYAGKGTARYQW